MLLLSLMGFLTGWCNLHLTLDNEATKIRIRPNYGINNVTLNCDRSQPQGAVAGRRPWKRAMIVSLISKTVVPSVNSWSNE